MVLFLKVNKNSGHLRRPVYTKLIIILNSLCSEPGGSNAILDLSVSSIDATEGVRCIYKTRMRSLQLKSFELTFRVIAGSATLIPSISLDILIWQPSLLVSVRP